MACGGVSTVNAMPQTATQVPLTHHQRPSTTAGLSAPISMTPAQPMPAAGSVAPQLQGFVGQPQANTFAPASMGAASDNLASEYGRGYSLHDNVSYKISDKTGHAGLYAFNGSVADFKAWQKKTEDHLKGDSEKKTVTFR